MTPPILEMTEDDVQEALNGNEGLFNKLVQRNRKILIAVLQRKGTSQNDTEDCAQHAFMQLWQYRERVEPSSSVIFSWLCNTALNKAKDIYKKSHLSQLIGNNEIFDSMMDPVEEALPDERKIPNLYAAIATLEDPFQAIILMQLSGLSYKEMAKKLKCPIGTIMSGRSRAVAMLKKEYKAGYYDS